MPDTYSLGFFPPALVTRIDQLETGTGGGNGAPLVAPTVMAPGESFTIPGCSQLPIVVPILGSEGSMIFGGVCSALVGLG